MEIDKLLKEYKNISLAMAENIKKEEEISSFLKKRESIINEINDLHIEKQIICDKIKEFNIIEIEKELEELIKNSMINIRKEIKKVKQQKEAHKKYTDFSGNAVIFSTKR
ncbi:hypothetical protein [uncultured Clostridium sp.]|uniref:hypothetical protein n=1 Tax=uncultured Clostridium sp. TaxID=59620 RepID=UPI0025D37E04|nr:hypothetical protein [uncultured Clostridium sp.]